MIRQGLKENDFLTNLDPSQVRELVDVMFQKEFKKGEYIIREGDPGQNLYVIEGNNIFSAFIGLHQILLIHRHIPTSPDASGNVRKPTHLILS